MTSNGQQNGTTTAAAATGETKPSTSTPTPKGKEGGDDSKGPCGLPFKCTVA